jgi:benzoyl-CoA reductase/2-hydroxyglutaryl-CoA dehydratase subunit BcrC/BadD/HgdB
MRGIESMAQTEGLSLTDRYYSHYGARARELKASGRKVVGYLSALTPIEMLTAAGVVPVRLKGDVSEAITKADGPWRPSSAPSSENVFDAALKGRFGYLDGMVMPHQCDSTEKTNNEWSYNLKLPYWHFLNVPHVTDDPSLDFFTSVLGVFRKSLERLTGHAVTDGDLARAVAAHNENRRAMRALYDLRKSDPPLISGVEMTKVLVAAMRLPVEESTALIEAVTREVKHRGAPSAPARGPRIMLIGDQIDDIAIARLIEGAGARLVMDCLSMGSTMYWPDVDATPDPLGGIAGRYLRKLKLPTTYVAHGEGYEENLEARFGHMRTFVEEFRVDAAVLFVYKYCDPYGFEVPAIKDFIEKAGASVLYLEDEYSTASLGRVKTRIEAFLEMIA